MFKPYFVILNCPNGGISPMVQEDGELATYDSYDDAAEAAEDNMLGNHFGYEVFQTGMGE